MSELRSTTSLSWLLVASAVQTISGASPASSDAISMQNTYYYGKIIDITPDRILFDVECSGNIYGFDKSLVSGIFPEGESTYVGMNGEIVSQPIYECSAPVDVTEATGGDGINSAGNGFCADFERVFGRKPQGDEQFFVVQLISGVYMEGGFSQLSDNVHYFVDDVEWYQGRPVGVYFRTGERRLVSKIPGEESIRIWRIWSENDPILSVDPNYCDWH